MLSYRMLATVCLSATLVQSQSVLAQDARSFEKVSFYFAAHEDDWQLFMNPSPFRDVADGKTKTVFIHLTAGDAGLGTGNGGRKHPYYLARENGAESAIRFMADAGSQPNGETISRPRFNGHRIFRDNYRNTTAYFLRLPDGHPSGAGFAGTGYQSLARLAGSQITTLTAIDDSTVYRGWRDLVSTLRAVLDFERGRAPSVALNVAELHSTVNPNDHSDHLMAAKAALDAGAGLDCADRLYYVDYASSKLPENLNEQERDMESSVLAVTAAGILAFDHTSIWTRYYQSYLGRNYFRVERGSDHCDEMPPVVNLLHAAVRPGPEQRAH